MEKREANILNLGDSNCIISINMSGIVFENCLKKGIDFSFLSFFQEPERLKPNEQIFSLNVKV